MNSKRGLFLAVTLMLAVGVLLFLLREGAPEKKTQVRPALSPGKTLEFQGSSLQTVASAKRPDLVEEKGCPDLWQALSQWEMGRFSSGTVSPWERFQITKPLEFIREASALAKRTTCRSLSEKHPLAASQTRFLKACSGVTEKLSQPLSEDEAFAVAGGCLSAVYFYRLHLADFLSASLPLEQINDPHLLANRLFAKLDDQSRLPSAPTILIARRLLQLDRREVRPAILAAKACLSDIEKGVATPETKKALQEFLDEAARRDPNNSELKEIQFAIAFSHSDIPKMKELAEHELKTGNDLAPAYYHLAWIAFLEGDKNSSRNYLHEMLSLETADPTLVKATLEKIDKPQAKQFPFEDTALRASLPAYFVDSNDLRLSP